MENKKTNPFIFYNNFCPLCRTRGTISFEDYFGNITSKIDSATNGVYKTFCKKCNTEFILQWNEEGIPGIVDKEGSLYLFEKEFTNNKKRDIDDILFSDLN